MALGASCNSSSCASQIKAKHQGVCPSGWHIPSDEDWNVLMKFVNPSCADNSNCAGAGTKLKSATGWNTDRGYIAGTDNYGFSALPGGYGSSVGSFYGVGEKGSWWIASEYDSDRAYYMDVNYYDKYAYYYYNLNGYYLLSVRCLQD